jgi:hypothetical protein
VIFKKEKPPFKAAFLFLWGDIYCVEAVLGKYRTSTPTAFRVRYRTHLFIQEHVGQRSDRFQAARALLMMAGSLYCFEIGDCIPQTNGLKQATKL